MPTPRSAVAWGVHQGIIYVAGGEEREPVMLAKFRADPAANPLKTPSGKIEIFSEKIASFGYDDCPGHATWIEPIDAHSTPSTPPSAHDGTMPGGGGSGYRHR